MKRGVSPVIGTVLLVMIVVSLGAAVMLVIQGISEEQLSSTAAQQELIQCGVDVQLKLVEVSDSHRICINPAESGHNGSVIIYLENAGLKNIQGWRFTVIGSNGIFDKTANIAHNKEDLIIYNFTYSQADVGTGLNSVDLVRLSPKVTGGATNPTVTCSEPNLEWDADTIADWKNCTDPSVTWDDGTVGVTYAS